MCCHYEYGLEKVAPIKILKPLWSTIISKIPIFAFRMEGQEVLNVLVGGTFVTFSFLLGGHLSLFRFCWGDVCLFVGIISSLDFRLDHDKHVNHIFLLGDVCLYSLDNFLETATTGKLHRLERCFLDWTNQCKSCLP